jgi:hypothetical protein
VVASSAGTTAQETKNEVQIKGKGQSEVDAIYQKTRSQTGAHPMGTAEQLLTSNRLSIKSKRPKEPQRQKEKQINKIK